MVIVSDKFGPSFRDFFLTCAHAMRGLLLLMHVARFLCGLCDSARNISFELFD
jgi:hypothetical protein